MPDRMRRELATALEGPDALRTLVYLFDELTLAGRSQYTGAGNDVSDAARALRGVNEIVRRFTARFGKLAGTGHAGYPTTALLDVVWEDAHGIEQVIGYALERSLRRIHQDTE